MDHETATVATPLEEVPAYRIAEAARYLLLPPSTLRAWVKGQEYRTHKGPSQFEPLIEPAQKEPILLSFINLVEAHVLRAVRLKGVTLQRVRGAIHYVEQELDVPHPLARQEFQTDGVDLFVEQIFPHSTYTSIEPGTLTSVSERGQSAFPQIIRQYLERVEFKDRRAFKLFPYRSLSSRPDEDRFVQISPGIAFGEPTLRGTSIKTSVLVERYRASETVEELASDFEQPIEAVQGALNWELCHSRAA